MDPTKRLTSEEAMSDPYFLEDPLPTNEYVPWLIFSDKFKKTIQIFKKNSNPFKMEYRSSGFFHL